MNVKLLPIFAICAVLVAAFAPQDAAAQRSEQKEEEQETRKTPAMREKVYNVLSEAQVESEAGNIQAALAKLAQVKKMKDLNSYELAQMWNFYGFIYFAEENYKEATRAYENLLAQADLPVAMETTTIYALAQLYFVAEDYPKAVEYLNRWFETANNPGPEAYVLLGQGYYQMKEYEQALIPVLKAIDLAKEKDREIKENWYLLLRTFYYELNDYPKMVNVLEDLLRQWPKKEYWLQVSGVYGELGEDMKQLIAYELAYMQGFLERSSEFVTLAQLFIQAGVPYKGAKVLQSGIDDGSIDPTAANYRLLSQALVMSREDEKAIPALVQAARLSTDGELDYILAQSYANLGRWEEAAESAATAVEKGGLKRVDLVHVLRGMSLYNEKRYGPAKEAFRAARTADDRSSKMANQWINHIEADQERERQLEAALAGG